MARVNKKGSSFPSMFSSSDGEENDVIKEVVNEFSGCEMSELLLDIIETAIFNQNPLTVSLNSENEDKLLELYGYSVVEFPVKENGGGISYYEGAIKSGDEVPKRAITKSKFAQYSKKAVLDRENQKLMLRVISWLISKFNKEDDND